MNIRKNVDYSDLYASLDRLWKPKCRRWNGTVKSGRLYANGVRRAQLLPLPSI